MNQKTYAIAFRLGASVSSSMRMVFANANRALSDLNKSSQRANKGTGTLSRTMGSLRGTVGRVTPALNGLGRSITSGVTAPISGAIGMVKQYAGALGLLSGGALAASGMGRLSAIENAQTSLEVMMGDAEKAKGFLEDVLAFAKTTPFAFPDLAESARNLIAFGMDSKKVVPVLKAIGDAAAATGKGSEGLNQVASAFGDMQVSGTLSMDQINRLAAAGVPALKILANKAGISVDQMKKQISSGTMSSVEAIDVLVEGMQKGTDGIAGKTAAMAGIMEKTKDNWTGAVDSLKSSISSTMAKIMEPIKPHVQAGMKWFGNTFSKLPDLIKAVSQTIKPVTDKIGGFFSSLAGPAKTAMRAIGGVFQLFRGYKSQAINIFSRMGLSYEQMQPIISKVDNIKSILSSFGSSIMDRFKIVKETIASLMPTFSKIGKNASSIFHAAAPAIMAFIGGIRSANSIIAPYVQKALGGIVAFVQDITGKIAEFWKENGAQITQAVKNVGSVLGAVFKVLMPVIGFIVQTVWANIKGAITGAINVIMGVVKFFSSLLTGDFKGMWQGIKQIFSGAIQFLWNAVNLLFVGRIISGIKGFVIGARAIISGMWSSIKGFFSGGVNNVWNIVVGWTSKLKGAWSSVKTTAVNMMISMWVRMKSIFGDIVSGAKALPGKIGDAIKSMAGKAWEGMKSLGNTMLRGIGNIVNGVIKGLKWIMGKLFIDFTINEWPVPQYARGTKGHPGGLAIVGDGGGPELIRTPDGRMGLSPGRDTLVNLPKGTQVLSHEHTKAFLNAIPAYKNGNLSLKAAGAWLKDKGTEAKNIALDVWDYVSNPSKLLTKVLEMYGVAFPKMAGVFQRIGSGAFSLVKNKTLEFLKKKLGDVGGAFLGSGPAAPEQVKRWIIQALNITNTPLSWLPAMLVKAQKESGYNPRAINLWDINAKRGIPSKGLFQTIDPTFNAYKLPGMNDIWNPIHNAVAAIRYIKARYGTVFNTPGIRSMARGGAYKGYAKGGRVPNSQWAWVGENGPELRYLPGGTRIFSHDKSKSLISKILSFGQSNDSTGVENSGTEQIIQVTYSPQFIIQGNANREDLEYVSNQGYEDFKRFMKQFKREQKRLAFE